MDSLKYDVFLSHSSVDQEKIVTPLYNYLTAHGVSCFYSPVSVVGGYDYTELLLSAIHDAKLFFLVFTEKANSSGLIKREAAVANAEGKKLFCMRCTDSPLNDALKCVFATSTTFDASSDNDKCVYFDDILAKIKGLLQSGELKPCAENINLSTLTPQELCSLGDKYFYGDGVEQDFSKAAECFHLASDKGLVEAQSRLGFLYQKGLGVEQDDGKALELYNLAAVQGDTMAQCNLGHLYEIGQGVEQDYAKAFFYYQLAADQGFSLAQNNLGTLYAMGNGVEQNYAKAAEYFKLAADQGHAIAQKQLGVMYQKGLGVEQDYNKAAEYYQLAANQGEEDALGFLNELVAEMNGQAEVPQSMDWESLDKQYVSEKELNLIYGAVVTYNTKALEGANPEICRIVTYKMAKTLAMRLEYPAEADKAFDFAYKQAKWLVQNAIALSTDDRTNLIDSHYLERLKLNIGQNVKALIQSDPRYEETFGSWVAIARFVDENAPSALTPQEPCALGDKYFYGYEIEQDYAMAVEYYKLAANQGYARAQNNLGAMYLKGYGVEQDCDKAMEYFKLAADQGEAMAQYHIGYMFETGQGVKQDYAKALSYFKLAAEQGLPNAQHMLGIMFGAAEGVEHSPDKCIKYFELAANQGYALSQKFLGFSYLKGLGVRRDYAKAIQYFQLAAAQGDAEAQDYLDKLQDEMNPQKLFDVGAMYFGGNGIEPDYKKSFEYFKLAANKGFADAQCMLGMIYVDGLGVEQDYAKAIEYFELAANQGNAKAQNQLGFMYEDGHGVDQDYEKAFFYFQLAASQGYSDAQCNLGSMYINGLGVEADPAEAFDCFELAAN